MTPPDSLSDLLERCRGAAGPDRSIDIALARAAGHPDLIRHQPDTDRFIMAGSKLDKLLPAYTASVDAALALTERLLPGRSVAMNTGDGTMPHAVIVATWMGQAPTLPLAILCALLQSLIAKGEAK